MEHVTHEEQLEKLGSFSLRKGRLLGHPSSPEQGEYRWRQTLLTDMLTVSSFSKTDSG